LDEAIGAKGKINGGVYQFSVPRKDAITERVTGSTRHGSRHRDQLSANRRRQDGDHRRLRDHSRRGEPLIRALRENGIEVTAIHSHMLDEQPRLFFIHFWANDDAAKLAKGLQAALEMTAMTRS
jgi:hypothetical protein